MREHKKRLLQFSESVFVAMAIKVNILFQFLDK